MSLGLGLALPYRNTAPFNPATLFASSQQGGWYDPADVITSWRRSLLTRSEEFDNAAWAKNRATVTPNTVNGPFGTLTADKLIEDTTASNTHTVTNQVTGLMAGVTYTFSLYARSSERTRVTLGEGNNTTGVATFDLSNGTIVTVSGNGSPAASISDAGGGWYRCALTLTLIGTVHNCQVYLNNGASATYTGDGTSGIFIWGAQLELGSTPTTYQRVTDVNSDFLAAFPNYTLFQDSAGTTPVTALGQPVGRINDKSGRGNHLTQTTAASRPTLEARVNLLTRTEQADDVVWNKVSATITPNAATAPDGTLTADKLIATAVLAQHRIDQTPTSPAGAQTFSVYLKAAEYAFAFLRIGTTGAATVFDLSNGLAVGSGAGYTANIQAVGNGWFRCSISVTSAAANDIARINALPTAVNTDYTGDGVSGILVWGAQLELGSTPTTYQRVTTATDYADIGAPRYLQFDGVDDFLTIGTFNMSASDKVAVCAGVRKLSDAAAGVVAELSATAATNAGSFAMTAPNSAAANYGWLSGGSVAGSLAQSAASFAAPETAVLSAVGDIAGDAATIFRNAVQVATSATDQGTGNYDAAYPLFVGRRGGTTLPLNGRVYGLVIRGGSITATERSQLERFMASRTGIAL